MCRTTLARTPSIPWMRCLIRTALGASRWSVIRESLRDMKQVFGASLAAGIIVAIVAVRLTASLISEERTLIG